MRLHLIAFVSLFAPNQQRKRIPSQTSERHPVAVQTPLRETSALGASVPDVHVYTFRFQFEYPPKHSNVIIHSIKKVYFIITV